MVLSSIATQNVYRQLQHCCRLRKRHSCRYSVRTAYRASAAPAQSIEPHLVAENVAGAKSAFG